MNACYVIIIIYIYLLILDTATSDVIINSTPSSQQVLITLYSHMPEIITEKLNCIQ